MSRAFEPSDSSVEVEGHAPSLTETQPETTLKTWSETIHSCVIGIAYHFALSSDEYSISIFDSPKPKF